MTLPRPSFALACILTALPILAVSACARATLTPAERLARLAAEFPCRGPGFTYRVFGSDSSKQSLSSHACSLVLYAIDQVKRGVGIDIGVTAADTNHIIFAQVTEIVVKGLTPTSDRLPAMDRSYWAVALRLANPERFVQLQLDKQSGRARLRTTEPFDTTGGMVDR